MKFVYTATVFKIWKSAWNINRSIWVRCLWHIFLSPQSNFVRRQEISWPMKQVIVELYSNGQKVSDIARSVNRSLASVYRVIGKFQKTESLENCSSTGNRKYWLLQRIVNRDRLSPQGELTVRFNENKPTTVFKKTVNSSLVFLRF